MDVATGVVQRHMDAEGPKFTLDPQSQRGALATDRHTIALWSRADPATTLLYGHDDKVLCVAWSPDGRRVASGSSDKTVRIWDPSAGAELLALEHDATVTDVAWSPDGRMLASASDDGVLRIWDSAPKERR
jgi:WD40 repeat protein